MISQLHRKADLLVLLLLRVQGTAPAVIARFGSYYSCCKTWYIPSAVTAKHIGSAGLHGRPPSQAAGARIARKPVVAPPVAAAADVAASELRHRRPRHRCFQHHRHRHQKQPHFGWKNSGPLHY